MENKQAAFGLMNKQAAFGLIENKQNTLSMG